MALTQIKTLGLADGTDGQILTYDANGVVTSVGPGTDGQVLTSTGAGSPPAFEDAVSEGTQVKSTGVSGTSSYLRADGDGTSSWQTVSAGTALTGSTDNTICTVTGANAIQGEANLTFDGNKLSLTPNKNGNNDGFEVVPADGTTASSFKVLSNNNAGADGRNGCATFIDANYLATSSTVFNVAGRGTDLFRITGGGDVCVGAVAPGEKLDVVGNARANTFILRANGSAPTADASIFRAADNTLAFATSNTERLRVTSAGSIQLNADGGSAYYSVGAAQDFRIYHDANGPTIFSDANNQGVKVAAKELKIFEYTGVTQRAEIDTSGNLKINDGNLIIGTSGHGIDFSATSDGSGTDSSELLDDYEEGSWTPTLDGLSNTPSWHNVVGKYTKIGNVVKCQGFLQPNTLPTFTTGSDVFKISGLPYAMSGVGYTGVIGNVMWQQIEWVGSSHSTYGRDDDTQITASISGGTKTEFATCGQSKYYMGRLKNSVFGDGNSWVMEWDMTYYTS